MESVSLLESARAGSLSALGQLLEQFRPKIRQQAVHLLDDRWQARADQSDLAQLTLTTGAHAFPAFRGTSEEELFAWLKAILQQHLAAMARWHLQTEMRSVGRESLLPADQESQGPADAGPSPSRMVIHGEVRSQLESAIADLPWDQREVIRLRYLDDWSTQQIAQFLEKSERAVAGLLRRGLSRLKHVLRDLE